MVKKKIKSIPNKSEKTGIIKRTEFELYARFLAFPTTERTKVFGGYTNTDFAKKYNVSLDTLTDWKKLDELWTLRDKYLPMLRQYTPDILKALGKRAEKEGKAPEVLTWMKVIEGYVDKQKIEKEEKILIINLNKDV